MMQEIGQALAPLADEIPGLQVVPYLNPNPTPPSLDVYPGDPFQTGAALPVGQNQVFMTVRGRVSTADQQAGQQLLLRMLDPNDPASVEGALATINWAVASEGVSGFREYLQEQAENGRLLGCEWRVTAFT